LEQTSSQLRDEKQRRKELQTQLSELRETNSELAAASDAAETVAHTAICISLYLCNRDGMMIIIITAFV